MPQHILPINEDILLEDALAPMNREELRLVSWDKETEAPRILVVDDEPSIVALVKAVLDGYTVGVATNGQDAMQLLVDGWEPDVIIMDLMMPKMTGQQAISLIKHDSRFRHIPVIAMSAGTNLRVMAQEAVQPDALLHKPFDIDTLQAQVIHLLRKANEPDGTLH